MNAPDSRRADKESLRRFIEQQRDGTAWPDLIDESTPPDPVPLVSESQLPELHLALKWVIEEISTAGAGSRKPTLERTWIGFVALLSLLEAPVTHGYNTDMLADLAKVSKPTFIDVRQRLSIATGIDIPAGKTSDHREKTAEQIRRAHEFGRYSTSRDGIGNRGKIKVGPKYNLIILDPVAPHRVELAGSSESAGEGES